MEKLCDEERYLELHTDIVEKAMYEEEEWKRYYESLDEGYKAVEFSYDSYGQPVYAEQQVAEENKVNPDDLPFITPAELQVPAGVHTPTTNKENAIIEKTAKFIAEHGTQMEIVMKTKQANNPAFNFMHFENELHPYYKHMIKMIKTKKYIPKSPVKTERQDSHNDSGEGDHNDSGYLHPTLVSNRDSPTPEQPYKPLVMPKVSIHETSYGQLLQSFAKVDKDVEKKNKARAIKLEPKLEAIESTLPEFAGQSEYSGPPPPGIEPVELPVTKIKQEPPDESEAGQKKQANGEAEDDSSAKIVPPPPDAQPIIDRMAMYVAKNGDEFAIVVKSKNDPRFQFLESWHPHHSYYDFKRHLFKEEMERERREKEEEEKRREAERAEQLARGVKFKLKNVKEQEEKKGPLERKAVFGHDESTDEESEGMRPSKSRSATASGTSTPIPDVTAIPETKNDEHMEKKLAEQRVKDRIAASAREKLSQADREAQMKLERKKKAAMFINLLKNKNSTETSVETTNAEKTADTDVKLSSKADGSKSRRKSKSKHKSSDRSRSRDGKRSRRSRSRSHGRSKKKKRKRSPTPPSAYNVSRRSPPSIFPPPPPPRFAEGRVRYSRSPSHSSRHRSRSRSHGRSTKQRSRSQSPSRSKSKKKKRSRSPRSRKDESKSKKSKKKKKRHSRSKERPPTVSLPSVQEEAIPTVPSIDRQPDPRVMSPAGVAMDTPEEGETRESTPEPGQITDTASERDHSERSMKKNADIDSDGGSTLSSPKKRVRSRSGSSGHSSRRSSRSSSLSSARSRSRSKSRSKSRSRSRSRSKSLASVRSSPGKSLGITPANSSVTSREGTPNPLEVNGDTGGTPPLRRNVSNYMLDRVRALIKASRKEEDMFADDDT
ncbi:splicing factor, suppressor of white-apricot homolog isoform X2 [Mya arenaria]|nr:splicing factor, suppressor of white-apricot homolog isoform X2 [Mya arenaria]